MSNSVAPKLVAEFIGTFAFVFIGAGAAAVVGDGTGLNGMRSPWACSPPAQCASWTRSATS
jgi:glycerol uptake facilitator-like aquaporin